MTCKWSYKRLYKGYTKEGALVGAPLCFVHQNAVRRASDASHRICVPQPVSGQLSALFFRELFVKFRIEIIKILCVQIQLDFFQSLAETLEMDNLALAQIF